MSPRPNQPIYKNGNNVPSPPNTYTVGGHGNATTFQDENNNALTPKQLADKIANDPNSKDKDVQLMSCNTGKGANSYAQQLSNALKKTVIAPDNYVWYYPDGKTIVAPATDPNISKPDLSNPGSWHKFTPAP